MCYIQDMAANKNAFGFDNFMERIKLEVAQLMLSGETGTITIHFNGNRGLRREINRRGEMVTIDETEVHLTIAEYPQS